MLTQQTLEKLYTMKLNGMADAFQQQLEDTDIANLCFEERFGLLVDQQWTWKENRALARRLAQARFKLSAAVEDIDCSGRSRLSSPISIPTIATF